MAYQSLYRRLALSGLAALLAIGVAIEPALAGAENRKHTVTVKFNYDFKLTPACSSTLDHGCVERFILYDISAGISKRTQLMTISLPAKPQGFVKGITATTAPLLFEPGKHWLAVVARMPDGHESNAGSCTVWVTVL